MVVCAGWISASEGVREERGAGGWVCGSGGEGSVEEVVDATEGDEGAASGIGAIEASAATPSTAPVISDSSSWGGPGSASSSP